MTHLSLLLALAVFTVLDALVTGVGLRVGCVELNPLVTTWGFEIWTFFRLLLLGGMLATFFLGRRLFLRYSLKASKILEGILLLLDFYIAAVVFFGVLAVCLRLLS